LTGMDNEPLHGQRGTILLAEEDVLVRMPIAHYLRECGYQVVEAVTTDEAMQALGHKGFTFNAVISSVLLAGDGFGISSWVKQHNPHLPVLLTGTPKKAVEAAARLCSDDPGAPREGHQSLLRRIQLLLGSRKSHGINSQRAMPGW